MGSSFPSTKLSKAYTPSKSAADLEVIPTPKRPMTEKGLQCVDPSTIAVKPTEPDLRFATENQWSRVKEEFPRFMECPRSPSSQSEYPAPQLEAQQSTTPPPLGLGQKSASSAVDNSLLVKLRLPKVSRTASAGRESERNTEHWLNESLLSNKVLGIDDRHNTSDAANSITMTAQNDLCQLPELVIDTSRGPSYTDLVSETQTMPHHEATTTKMAPITPMTPQIATTADQIPVVHGRSISGLGPSAPLNCGPAETRSKPALQFMFQRPNGRPDRKYLMPRKGLFDLSLSELFLNVSNRTNKPPDSLTCVTLRYLGWGEGEALVVQRDGSEEDWNDTKEEILIVFKDAVGEYPKKKEFLIWIKCGDRTKMEQKHDSDSDC
jgi:hypothetical protein